MLPSLSEVRSIIKNPKGILKYWRRERNLERFLKTDRSSIEEYLAEANDLTKRMTQETGNLESTPSTMLTKLRGPIVYVCVRTMTPSVMIETGVAHGASTHYIVQAMECNGTGHLYSIDQPNLVTPLPFGKEPGWLVPSELKDRWTLIRGSTREHLLPLLQRLQEIDAFLHDSEHTYETMRFEYETVWPHLKTPGLLLTDNVHGTQAFHDFVRDQQLKAWITFDGLGAIRKEDQRNSLR